MEVYLKRYSRLLTMKESREICILWEGECLNDNNKCFVRDCEYRWDVG